MGAAIITVRGLLLLGCVAVGTAVIYPLVAEQRYNLEQHIADHDAGCGHLYVRETYRPASQWVIVVVPNLVVFGIWWPSAAHSFESRRPTTEERHACLRQREWEQGNAEQAAKGYHQRYVCTGGSSSYRHTQVCGWR